MASIASPACKVKKKGATYAPMHFQRGKGVKRTRKKKIRLKLRHIIFSLFFVGGIFFFIQQSYLFLISWDYLNIKEVNVLCSHKKLKKEIQQILHKQNLRNILLLDINKLRQALTSNTLVKEAHIRKLFPSTLKIEIVERKPMAILNKKALYLVDEEGIILQKISSREMSDLPLLLDSENFQHNYEEKITFAWECLKSLPAAEKKKINTVNLSDYGWVYITLKNEPTKIKCSRNVAQNLAFFSEHEPKLEHRFGPLEYIDLRFEDRIYIKAAEKIHQNIIPNASKEVQ